MKSPITSATLSGWSRNPAAQCQLAYVDSWDALNSLDSANLPAIARGNGRSYGDASFVSTGTTYCLSPRNHFIEFDSKLGILRAEAGVTIGEVLDVIVPHGWFLRVTPGTRFATLGGCVAADVHGKNHQHEGSFAKCIERMTVRVADGTEVVCSPLQNVDLFHATCGGLGLTGIVREVTLGLQPVETGWFQVRYMACPDLPELLARIRQFESGEEYLVAWIDGLARGAVLHRSILSVASHATLESARAEELPSEPPRKRTIRLPIQPPEFLLNRSIMRIYNGWRNAHFTGLADAQFEWYSSFLYPLDQVENWNLLYGRRGFLQYQFAVPFENAQLAISEAFALLDAREQSVYLAVLKLLGDEAGPLSFPRRGVTLALDLPMTGRPLLEALDALDERIVAHGGRVYLAKDSRMNSRWLSAMYPRIEEWRHIKREMDPQNVFQSDLARRLGLLA